MIKQIRYFQAVVRCKSFTEAAEECFISQSAISQQIQALEHELGVKLLNRENRKFSLTPAGEHFYQKSLVLMADFERLCHETVRIANKDNAELRIGYLKCYGGQEFRLAVAEFSEKYPDVSVHIINGNHEDLYDALRNGGVDLILSDQRRAFSDEYVNFILTTNECYIELAARNPLASYECVETEDLKNISCILVASPEQQENERTYYKEIVGIKGEFLFAQNLEEARLLVIGGKGFMPIEGGENEPEFAAALRRMLLTRKGKPIKRNYCAFWKTDNSGYYVEDFADILKSKFPSGSGV
ncbi:MAG: LysR family transcriptional regulator [Lachnospiraceae bacterium]|nr:LysR family transcriptional regulator [Lachnospiraceae bacterium]